MPKEISYAPSAMMQAPEPVTWAGRGFPPNKLCLGTEMGRLFWVDPDRGVLASPSNVVGSGEAINGAAFTDKLMVVSNRSEVVVQEWIPGVGPVVLEGGAHGVIASESGKIIAPRGSEGLLIISPSEDGFFTPTTLITPGAVPYFYQTVQVGPSEDGQEWFASACRDDGIALIRLGPGGERGEFQVMRRKNPRTGGNADIVSLCSLNRPGYLYSLALLAVDGTVYFTTDVRTLEFTGMAFDKLDGTPYTILSAQSHLFILTSEKLYFMKDFADRSIRNPGGLSHEPVSTFSFGVDAVDCSIVDDEYLVIAYGRHLTLNRVSELSQGLGPAESETKAFQPSEMMATLLGAA